MHMTMGGCRGVVQAERDWKRRSIYALRVERKRALRHRIARLRAVLEGERREEL